MAGHGEQQPRVLGGHEVELGQVVSNLRLEVVQSEQGRVRLSNWTVVRVYRTSGDTPGTL